MSARVLSVNVTEPRLVVIKGREVATSIYKRSTPEPVLVEAEGFVGERRISRRMCGAADHAVYMYPHEHYATWQRELGEGPFPYGQFGENLTTVGLSEGEIRLGDVLACGQVRLRVRQPRLPCAKLNARMGRRFAGRFLRSRRLGFFLSVLEPGLVRGGDAIRVLERDDRAPSVDELIRVSQIDYWDAVGLEALVACTHLPPAWRDSLQEKLDVARRAEGWHGLRPLRVVDRRPLGAEEVLLTLRCPQGRPLAPFAAGQYLTVAWRSPDDVVTRRSYVIASSPGDTDVYRIAVRRVPGGVVSTALSDEVGIGDELRVAAPRGHVTLDDGSEGDGEILLVSDGWGVPTIRALVAAWSARGARAPATYVRVVVAGEAPDDEGVWPDALRRLVVSEAPPDVAPSPPEQVVSLAARAARVLVAGATSFADRWVAALGAPRATTRVETYGR